MTDPYANINPLTGKPYSSAYYGYKLKFESRPMERPAVISQLIEELMRFPIVFLKAGTGTGKTTSIGRRMLDFFRVSDSEIARVAVTQPRRLPATSISTYVAKEMDVKFGDEVGFKVKGTDNTSDKTVLAFVTEGQIFADFTRDEDIHKWKGLVLDEVHTRTVEVDLVMFLLKDLLVRGTRPDMRFVIMSATADLESLKRYFGRDRVGIVEVEGTNKPVEKHFALQEIKTFDVIKAGTAKILEILNDKKLPTGDILMFLPGSKDLTKASMTLTKMGSEARRTFVCLQLEAKTDEADKKKVENVGPAAFGVDVKVVFATNIAEASLTVEGLVYVVDSGLEKASGFDPVMNCSTLDTRFISQAQISQRWGRVGRTQPGYAYSLYTEQQYQKLDKFPTPAMKSTDLTGVALSLMKNPHFYCVAGVVHAFRNMLDPPSSLAIQHAIESLAYLGALQKFPDQTVRLSDLGLAMADLPVSPEMARSLIFSRVFGCHPEVLRMAAIMGEEQYTELFVTDPDAAPSADPIPAKYRNPLGECFGALDLFMEYEALPANPDPEDTKLEVQTAFCLENRVKLQKMEDAKKTYRSLRNSLMRSEFNFNSLRKGRQVRVTIPFLDKSPIDEGFGERPQSAEWLTMPVTGSSAVDKIMRCLLMGHFRGTMFSRDGKSSQCLKTNITIAADSKRPWAPVFPWAMWKSMMRIDKKIFALSGVTKVDNPMWILDAGEHYLKPDVLPPEMKAVWNARQRMLKELEELGPDPEDYLRTY
jgi:HrpA-like RNA helicase